MSARANRQRQLVAIVVRSGEPAEELEFLAWREDRVSFYGRPRAGKPQVVTLRPAAPPYSGWRLRDLPFPDAAPKEIRPCDLLPTEERQRVDSLPARPPGPRRWTEEEIQGTPLPKEMRRYREELKGWLEDRAAWMPFANLGEQPVTRFGVEGPTGAPVPGSWEQDKAFLEACRVARFRIAFADGTVAFSTFIEIRDEIRPDERQELKSLGVDTPAERRIREARANGGRATSKLQPHQWLKLEHHYKGLRLEKGGRLSKSKAARETLSWGRKQGIIPMDLKLSERIVIERGEGRTGKR